MKTRKSFRYCWILTKLGHLGRPGLELNGNRSLDLKMIECQRNQLQSREFKGGIAPQRALKDLGASPLGRLGPWRLGQPCCPPAQQQVRRLWRLRTARAAAAAAADLLGRPASHCRRASPDGAGRRGGGGGGQG